MSVLVIHGLDASAYALRGTTQSLRPIDQTVQLRRTVNGELIDVSDANFRKYRSTITGADQLPPAFDGIWPGMEVTVECISELSYKTAGGAPERPVAETATDETPATRTEGAFTFYRPALTMRVVSFNQDTDEYGATVSWTLELEEV